MQGLRYTDEETMEVVQMVLTENLIRHCRHSFAEGGKACGLSGVDSGLLRAKK